MSIFLDFLFEVCGLYVWVCTSGVSYNLCFHTQLFSNIQTARFYWISCLSFPTLDDRALAFLLIVCAKGTIFMRYASVGKECWKCEGIAKIGL